MSHPVELMWPQCDHDFNLAPKVPDARWESFSNHTGEFLVPPFAACFPALLLYEEDIKMPPKII